MKKIFWTGDSTVQTNNYLTYPQTGIGQVFPLFIKPEYQVENYAKNGRSTKSFIDEGRLAAIEGKIGKGDFLFIQFGHNDEKNQDPSRYTEPFTTYMDNLMIYIETARQKGAFPVLITPLERRCFVDDKHLGIGAHSDYVAAMKQTAEKSHTAMVDLYSCSRTALKHMGELESRKWYMYFPAGIYSNHPDESRDNTHLRYEGAVYFGSMIAKGLASLGGIFGAMILDELRF